eukprot:SAG22_NODE_3684_length_1579_cov_4.554730_2_plen_300_part_00
MPATGSLIILHNQAVALLPQFYVGNALIVGGRNAEQLVWRTTGLQAQLAAIAAEVAWTGLHAEALPPVACAACLLLAALLNGLHLCVIHGLVPAVGYTAELGFGLSLARGLLLVPANQLGAVWTLRSGAEQSQARWRICGWILTIGLGLAVLLLPALAESPLCVVAAVSAPSLLAAALLLCRPAAEGEAGAAAGDTTTTTTTTPARVPAGRAAAFLFAACVLGTNGEALLDTAVGLTVRNSLVKDKSSSLALANQAAVLGSMLLALLSETVLLTGSAAKRSTAFIALWLGETSARSRSS